MFPSSPPGDPDEKEAAARDAPLQQAAVSAEALRLVVLAVGCESCANSPTIGRAGAWATRIARACVSMSEAVRCPGIPTASSTARIYRALANGRARV